jgi:dephospho-CoA kinase
MNTIKRLIGIAGPTASGKTTAATHIAKICEGIRAKYSDVLVEEAQIRSLALDKASLQALSITLRQEYGNSYLANRLQEKLSNVDADVLIIEGNRLMDDMYFLEKFAIDTHRTLSLLYIDADASTRFARTNARSREVDTRSLTRAEFDTLEADQCEAELPEVKHYIVSHPQGTVVDSTSYTEPEFLSAIVAWIRQWASP